LCLPLEWGSFVRGFTGESFSFSAHAPCRIPSFSAA